jgi:hypothetical protein
VAAIGRSATMKRIAIIQSNYIPWKGYFDIIAGVDEFILFDNAQYTRRDWRNRNQIKTPQGPQWLTIPVEAAGKYHQRICETRVSHSDWRKAHWQKLRSNYSKAPHFADYADRLEQLYLGADEAMLSRINHAFITAICEMLGVRTRLSWSTDYVAEGAKTERLVNLCRAAGASHYLSGPSAREYIQPDLFTQAGITLEYMDYSNYPPYPQLHGAFEHAVTVLDLIFNTGAQAGRYMKNVAAGI